MKAGKQTIDQPSAKAHGTRPLSEVSVSPLNGQVLPDDPMNQTGVNHPLAGVVGMFADDPLWDEFIEAMERSRREIDAKFNPIE